MALRISRDVVEQHQRIADLALIDVDDAADLALALGAADVRDFASRLHLREPGTQILLRRVGGAGCRSRIDVLVHDSSRSSLVAHYSRDEYGKAIIWRSPAGSCGDSLTRTARLSLFRGSHAQHH